MDEEAEPLVDLLQDARADLELLRRQALGEAGEPDLRIRHRQFADLADMAAVDLHRQRLGLEPVPAAGLARRRPLVTLQLLAQPGAVGLAPAPFRSEENTSELQS